MCKYLSYFSFVKMRFTGKMSRMDMRKSKKSEEEEEKG